MKPTADDARWARGLRRYREHLGLTQAEVADRVGIPHRSTVCELESGRKVFSRATLLRLTALFDGTLAETMAELDRWGSAS